MTQKSVRSILPFLLPAFWLACSPGGSQPAGGDPEPVADLPEVCPSFEVRSEGLPTDENWRFHSALGDVNGDGFLDLAAIGRKGKIPRVFVFEEGIRWREASEGLRIDGFPCGGTPLFQDPDGDGDLDLFLSDHCTGLYLFLGDGTGRWERARNAFQGSSARLGMNSLDIGDLDLDGDLDIVGVSAFTRGFQVFEGDGAGQWTEAETNLPGAGGGYRVRLQDLNADGRLDILNTVQISTEASTTGVGRGASPVWLNMGDGQFRGIGTFPDGLRAWDIVLMGSTGDHPGDLLLSGLGTAGGLHKLSWNPDTARFDPDGDTSWNLPAMPENSCTGLALTDFNNDGRNDLAVARYRPGSATLFIAADPGVWTECPLDPGAAGGTVAPFWGLNAGDLNADGKIDLVANQGTEGTGRLIVWIQN